MFAARTLVIPLLALAVAATACSGDGEDTLTVYSGRKEELIAPLLEQFEAETGIDLEVRYANSTDLAATLREEGGNTPADVFFAVDPASLGAVAAGGLLARLPDDILSAVPAGFSDREGRWVGTSGRSRVIAYDDRILVAADLPDDVGALTDPQWKGRIGIAPTNGSFLASVAAMILIDGEEATREWLDGIAANEPLTYPKNSVIAAAIDEGEIEVGLVNHYYPLSRAAELGSTAAANHFLAGGAGALVMPAGVGILEAAANNESALAFVRFLLSEKAQRFFVEQTFEYPLAAGVVQSPELPPLESLNPPDLDLSDLASALDLATDLVAEAGLL
jgi:iron(III) transport system substrate-binding protein